MCRNFRRKCNRQVFAQNMYRIPVFLILASSCMTFGFMSSSMKIRAPMRALNAAPTDETDKVFYTLGLNVARQVGGELKQVLSPAEMQTMVQGFQDSLTGGIEDDMPMLQEYGPKLNEILTQRAADAIGNEKKAGADYVASFLLKTPNAVQTASGLVFSEVLAGTGPKPGPTSTVEVHYHGTLTDGTVFDSSVDRGQTIKFPLNGVIKGWQEGVQMMRVGSKATLVCPSDIAYGDNGSPPVIPPGATLTFEVELKAIVS